MKKNVKENKNVAPKRNEAKNNIGSFLELYFKNIEYYECRIK